MSAVLPPALTNRTAVWFAALLMCATAGAQDLPGQQAPTAVSTPSLPVKPVVKGEKTFLMSAFMATSQNKLSLFSSTDGVTFTSLASEAYQPPKDLLRDPSIIRGADGLYYIAYTTNWDGSTFGIAKSADLKTWSHVGDVTVKLPGVTNVWAPEWFRDADGSLHLVMSLSKGGTKGPFAAYTVKALDAGFTKFADPVPMAGLDKNYIDTFVVLDGGRYTAFVKNETTKVIELATAPSLNGPWTLQKTGDWAGWGNWTEGQALVPIKGADGKPGWRIYFDEYTTKRYWYSDSFDDFQTWTPKKELGGVSGTVRHFTVISEDTAQLERATAPKSKPKTIAWDRHSLIIDGKREMIFGGEFHPFRLPSPALWRDVLQKMKASGLNTVAFYFAWGYHSAKPGHYDFTGIRNVERALEIAKEEGMYVIARMGPYVNAELTAGGFPGWLLRQRAEARTDAAEYQAATDEWMTQINAILARHQLTNGGGNVIAYQLENELFAVNPKNIRHMQHLADKARADGITVPLFHNAASRLPDWTPKTSTAPFANPGPTDIYAFDGYPGGVCDVFGQPGTPAPAPDWGIYGKNFPKVGSLASPNTPGFVAEIGAGWFDYWGSNGTYECTAKRQGPGYQRVFYGSSLINSLTIHSIYMAFGGTSWGWLAGPVVYTSYDYGSPINESRALRDKAMVLKQMGGLVQSANAVLAAQDKGEVIDPGNAKIRLYHNVNKALGSHVLLAQHNHLSGTAQFGFKLQTKDGSYQIPQAGKLTLTGQDAKMLLASYALERQHLVYSTSELQSQLQQGARDVALLYGRDGDDGETVLRYSTQPTVKFLRGSAQVTWDAKSGDLRLNYAHKGLIEVLISGGSRAPLLLLLADEKTGWEFWRLKAGDQTVLVRSPALVRTAAVNGKTLALTGDTTAPSSLRAWVPDGISALSFNGQALAASAQDNSLVARATLPGPEAVQLPDLMKAMWTRRFDSLEADPKFDDSAWRKTDAPVSAANVYTATDKGQPVLAMSDYGFHHGDVWYRGRFTTTDAQPLKLELFFGGGGAGVIQVWVDGKFIGQQDLDTGRPFPETTDTFHRTLQGLSAGEHVIAVVVRNNSHNWDLFADDVHKEARGLISASLTPKGGQRFGTPIAWKIQGNKGGEDIADLVRGPMNNGGLHGERMGWHLPVDASKPQAGWDATQPGAAPSAPGTYWLRTNFKLDMPQGHDVQLGLAFGDTTKPRSDRENRALIFVNGWNLGQFIAHIGPQRVFVLPPGILNPNGDNTLTLAVTTDGDAANALEPVKLVPLAVARGGVPLEPVPQPRTLAR
ncbi:beta-galactosidase [Roseateles sp. DC23W]|uniref:beta-galactosidase n=1 Tax=Pelomonas dachongensis TaxID=3299029 RepID=A0ABW7EIC0_9BURK